MYNPNNVIIGGAIIFLVAYAFFILRRMYKRRISVLEQTNLELTNALKEITDMEQDHMEQAHMEQDNGIENISADLFRQNGEAFTKARESNVIFEVMNHSQKIPTNSVEIESIQEIPNTVPQNVETIPENIVIESRSGNYTESNRFTFNSSYQRQRTINNEIPEVWQEDSDQYMPDY